MGKYLIISSESLDNKIGARKLNLLFGKEDSDDIKLAEESLKKCCSEGGRCRDTDNNLGTDSISKRRKSLKLYLKLSEFLTPFLIVVLLLVTLLRITMASPTPPSLINQDNVNRNQHSEHYEDYDFSNEDDQQLTMRSTSSRDENIDSRELDKIRISIMEDLGLAKIPDPLKANVSQTEYEKAHREYLKRLELSNGHDDRTRRRLHVYYPTDHVIDYNNSSSWSNDKNITEGKTGHSIHLKFELPVENHYVDHSTLRILIDGHHSHHNRYNQADEFVEVSIYQRTRSSRRFMTRQRVLVSHSSPRWAEFDSTEVVASWLNEGEENLGFEMEIKHEGYPVRWIKKWPDSVALNIFTISDNSLNGRNRRAIPDQLMSLHRGRRTECRGQNKKCCRHQMTVIFKDLKGFEFIIQPKDFDAGYCKGRCPPRYNPAHHHALLQSLIWKEDRKKAPRPCCAPSKLTELEILYFDDEDPTKLKVSNWKNMKVLECACS